MTISAPTDLTVRQIKRLDSMARNEPLTVVIGWSYVVSGPIIRRIDGSKLVLGPKGYVRGYVN